MFFLRYDYPIINNNKKYILFHFITTPIDCTCPYIYTNNITNTKFPWFVQLEELYYKLFWNLNLKMIIYSISKYKNLENLIILFTIYQKKTNNHIIHNIYILNYKYYFPNYNMSKSHHMYKIYIIYNYV